MGLLVRAPDLPEGETILWHKNANREQGRRGVGGWLLQTERRILFQPGRLDRLMGGRGWSVPLGDVRHLDVARRSVLALFAGGLRSRLSITTTTSSELFVVNDLRECLRRLIKATNAVADEETGWTCWRV